MTLEEAKAILAPIREAEEVVRQAQFEAERAARVACCARGDHLWKRNDPRARVPYCDRCGKEHP